MNDTVSAEIVIKGVTRTGKIFRPSDWAERLAGVFSMMGDDHRMHYSDHVQPVLRAGLRCVVIRDDLASRSPGIYQFLMSFAQTNDLEVIAGRQSIRIDPGAPR